MSTDTEHRKWTAAELNDLPDDAVIEDMHGNRYEPCRNAKGERYRAAWWTDHGAWDKGCSGWHYDRINARKLRRFA